MGLEELVITDTQVQINQADVIDIAFVFLENNLYEYKHHGPLQGIDNVYIIRFTDDGTPMTTFNSFSTDYLVADGPAVRKIDRALIISTHDLACDYCNDVFIGFKHIQSVVVRSLTQRSAKQGASATTSSRFYFPSMVFLYIVRKTGMTITDWDKKSRGKFDTFLLPNMDFIKIIRSYDYTGISCITDADIKQFIQVFGNCSIIGKRELFPKKDETVIFGHNDVLNMVFPPKLSLSKTSTGIRLMYCPEIKEMTVKVDYNSYINKPPIANRDALHKQRQWWWYLLKMIPAFSNEDSIDTTNTTTSAPVVKVGDLFLHNRIPYRVVVLSNDGIHCDCEIAGPDASNELICMKIAIIIEILVEQNKK